MGRTPIRHPDTRTSDIPALVGGVKNANRAALARLLTIAAAGEERSAVMAALEGLPKRAARVVALTGSGGVGKSSLLGAVAAHFVASGQSVGVLACDPESSVTGGALLGDRCRIAGDTAWEKVFIRSLATAAGQQGLAKNIEPMLDVMKAFGFDRIFIETVGVGQGDIAVREVADIVVLVVQPQTGDELQWEKAGILEITDIVVVNKSDLPGSDGTAAEIAQQLQTTSGPATPVVKTSVARIEGIDELCRVLNSIIPKGSHHSAQGCPPSRTTLGA
jgi:LAO/AO transport system ATPase